MNLIKLLHIWWWPLKQHLNIWNGRKYFSMLSICGNLKDEALSKGLIFELNIYIGEYMAMAVFYGEYLITNYSMWGSKFVAGQGRTWPNRTFPVSTSKYSSWSQAIQVNRKKLLYHTLRSDLHCMFSETNISYRADRPKLCFGQTCWQDFLLKKGNGTNYAVRHGMTQSGQIRWENQTVSNSLTNSFGHFFSFPPKLTFINITLTFRVNFITRKIMNDKTRNKAKFNYQNDNFHNIL